MEAEYVTSKNKIMMIGEAWGDAENLLRKPFVGPSGDELNRMCEHSGINRDDCYLTNVFNFQPPNNDLDELCVPHKDLPKPYPIKTSMASAKWLLPKYNSELERLHEEIHAVNPNVIIAFGATPTWALLHEKRIFKHRGVTAYAEELVNGLPLIRSDTSTPYKVVPTFHPAFILRSWQYRIVAVADMIKARGEAKSPLLRYPEREIRIAETLEDIKEIDKELTSCDIISFDVETASGQITCISFAPSKSLSLVIPFWDKRKPNWSYWTLEEEIEVRLWMQKLLASDKPKLAQNSLYDTQYCLREKMPVLNLAHDTMLIHHALWPELPKGLGFMASVHTNSPAWKGMAKTESLKRDD